MMNNSVSDKIYDVVRLCIWAGVTVEEFLQCAEKCWEDVLKDEIKFANKKFDKLKGF